MKILVEPSDYVIRNFGDTAMLEAGLTRLSKTFPEYKIFVFSDHPGQFPAYCENVTAVSTKGRKEWFKYGFSIFVSSSNHNLLARILRRVDYLIAWRFPFIRLQLVKLVLKIKREDIDSVVEFYTMVQQSKYLVVTGMGGLTDSFSQYALELLAVLRLSQKLGNKVALFGQGIGPISNDFLFQCTKSVLKDSEIIALRESKFAVPILKSMGVNIEKIFSTGDDAIELAYQKNNTSCRECLGINIRSASYSGVSANDVMSLKIAVQKSATALKAELVALPISRVPGEQDMSTIDKLTEGYFSVKKFDSEVATRSDLLDRMNLCRLVITGSYHGGVFALSMGIPVVCIVSSDYYYNKFYGLKSQFNTGVAVIRISEDNWTEVFEESVSRLWIESEGLRDTLLHEARNQIKQSHSAYAHLFEIVTECA